MALNINAEICDDFYRYKMPRLLAKVEGRGNGIKTVVVNIEEVSKALSRPPAYATKFFGIELGAQTQCDKKNQKYIVSGEHTVGKLQDLLGTFIKKFVLCDNCQSPETDLKVYLKKELVTMTCAACGFVGHAPKGHRLIQYILKNPPEISGDVSGVVKKDKGKKNGDHKDGSPIDNGVDIDELGSPGSDEALDDEDDGFAAEDFTEEARRARMEGLSMAAQKLAIDEVTEVLTPAQKADKFFDTAKQFKKSGQLLTNARVLLTEAELLDLKDKAPVILVEVIFDNAQEVIPQIEEYRPLLLQFTAGSYRAQKSLLLGFTTLIGTVFPGDLLPKVALLLQKLYTNDLVEESAFISWHSKLKENKVADAAKPFIDWLQEAASESDDDDDGEDDDADNEEAGDGLTVAFDRATTGIAVKKEPNPQQTNGNGTAAPAPVEDDIDIDNI